MDFEAYPSSLIIVVTEKQSIPSMYFQAVTLIIKMAAIKQLVNSLHSSLGIAEFQYQHHSRLLARKNELLVKLGDMKIIKEGIDAGKN